VLLHSFKKLPLSARYSEIFIIKKAFEEINKCGLKEEKEINSIVSAASEKIKFLKNLS